MEEDVVEKIFANKPGVDLGLEFLKAHYIRPNEELLDSANDEWDLYKVDEQHRIEAINKIAHLIGSIVIMYTAVPNLGVSCYSLSAAFHMKDRMFFGDNLKLNEDNTIKDADWNAFIDALLNEEQWNETYHVGGIDRTIIFYNVSY